MAKYETYIAEKEVLQKRNEYLAKEIRRYIEKCGPGEMSTDVSYLDADNIHGSGMTREAYHQLSKLSEMIDEFNENAGQLGVVSSFIEKTEQVLKNTDDLPTKVKYMRDVCGYNLLEISNLLGYTHQYIRRVASKL